MLPVIWQSRRHFIHRGQSANAEAANARSGRSCSSWLWLRTTAQSIQKEKIERYYGFMRGPILNSPDLKTSADCHNYLVIEKLSTSSNFALLCLPLCNVCAADIRKCLCHLIVLDYHRGDSTKKQ